MSKPDTGLRVVVVGAGPAGLAAAQAAAGPGVTVTMLDDNPAPGGQVWRSGPQHRPSSWSRAARKNLVRSGVTVFNGCRVIGVREPGTLMLDSGSSSHVPATLAWDRLILATGARERFMPFPGWTLPGVTGAGGAQALVKSGVPVAGKRIIVSGSGPLLLASAATLKAAGAHILMIAEQAPSRAMSNFMRHLVRWPAKLLQAGVLRARLADTPYHWDSYVVAAGGEERLYAVRISTGGVERTIECDWLACGFGLHANLELAHALGCAVRDRHGLPAVQVNVQQQTSISGVYAAGETTGIGGVEKAWAEGRSAGLAATGHHLGAPMAKHHAFGDLLNATFALRPELMNLAEAKTILCRCEDVSLASLREYADWRSAKLATRCGMGACQGRICVPICHDVLGWRSPVPSLLQGIRQPIQPVSVERLLSSLNNTPG